MDLALGGQPRRTQRHRRSRGVWKAQPPCGYKYHWRSLKERSDGTGTWPITATTNWTVTWQSNTGVTGGTTLNATSNDQFDIGEYRTVLVKGAGG